MKRFFWFAMALTLMLGILPAQAEDIDWQNIVQIKQETPTKWQQTYETMWRTITIDADVTVPNVEAVPIFRVTYLTPLPDAKLVGYDRIHSNSEMCLDVAVGRNPQEEIASKYLHTSAFPSDPSRNIYLAGAIPDRLPENNPLTYDEARSIADQAFRSLYGYGLERFTAWRTWVFDCLVATSKGELTDKRVTERGYYWLEFNQLFAGIPMKGCDVYLYQGGRRGIGGRGVVSIEVVDADNYRITTTHLETKDQPYADVPLRSFADTKAAFEELIKNGYIREIESVELCYAPYNDPNDENVLWLVPVWRAYCVIDEKAEHEAAITTNEDGTILDYREWAEVVFEAQRGTLMDPNDRSKTRRDVPEIITWEQLK